MFPKLGACSDASFMQQLQYSRPRGRKDKAFFDAAALSQGSNAKCFVLRDMGHRCGGNKVRLKDCNLIKDFMHGKAGTPLQVPHLLFL